LKISQKGRFPLNQLTLLKQGIEGAFQVQTVFTLECVSS
jgi:hypothetical protein